MTTEEAINNVLPEWIKNTHKIDNECPNEE